MTFLTQVTKGKIKKPWHVILYGTPKVGKSTWASDSESPIFMDIEEGTDELDVSRLPKPKTFTEALAMLQELTTTSHSFKTLVIDSLDHLEALCNAETAQENGVTSVGEMGFGKGYALSLAKWQKLYEALTQLNQKMNLVMIAHSQLKKIDDPTKQAQYDKHDLKLRDQLGALAKEKADAILFAVFETHVTKDKNTGKGRAIGDGSRILLTQGRPSHEGGNRFGLPYILPLNFEDFQKSILDPHVEEPKTLIDRITQLSLELKDESIKEKVSKAMKDAKEDTTKLAKILDRLETILSQKVA